MNITRRDSRDDLRLSFLMIMGTVAGTLFCSLMTGSMKEELCFLEESLMTFPGIRKGEWVNFFLTTAFRRAAVFLFLWIAGMTDYRNLIYGAGSFFAGFTSAVFLSALTMVKGLRGLFFYLSFLSPHGICYIFLMILLIRGSREKRKPEPSETLIKAGFLGIGILTETVVNPLILTWIL